MDVYVIYLRKSRADVEAEKLGEGETLSRHKKILSELAARKGLYVGKIYQEIVSGETIEDRPEIQKMIQECYEGKYRGIIVIDVDRLSRGNQGDMQTIMDTLRYGNDQNGVLVVTPTKTYDVANNSDDEEYMEFVLFMSRREYKTIQKRLERGRRQAVVEGNYMAAARPYGYDIKKGRRSRTLVPNPEESHYVKKIYEWTLKDNLSPGRIAKRLDTLGVPTYTGEDEWNPSTVRAILKNPTYYGKVQWNDRMTVKTMVDGKLKTSRPKTNNTNHYMLYDGKHEPLVTKEMFDEAAKKFKPDKTRHNLKLVSPLAGLLVCAKCGKMMKYQSFNTRPDTKDRYIHMPGKKCRVKSAMVDDVIDAVIHSLKLYIEDFELKLDGLPTTDENSIQEQINDLRAELKKIEKRQNKIYTAWEDDQLSDNEFVKRKAYHTNHAEEVEKMIEELENTIPEKEDYADKIVRLSDALEALQDKEMSAGAKNIYLKSIIERIEFSRENGTEFILDIFPRQ